MHFYLEASRYLVAYPARDILGSRIKRKDFIDIPVVQLFFHRLFDMAEINHHSIGIQLFGTAENCDYPIVTMQILTFTLIGKFQAMGSRNFHSFNDCIHTVNTLIKISFL